MTLDEIASLADRLVPEATSGNRRALNSHRTTVMCGLMYELSKIRPSTTEIGAALGTHHTTAINGLERWRAMHWRDRHGWLMLAEQRA